MMLKKVLVCCLVALSSTAAVESKPMCCKVCPKQGENKYVSVDPVHGHCGEACIQDSQYPMFHIFEKWLVKANSSTPCADEGFPVYRETETHGVWPIQVTVDLYDKP